MSEFKLSEFFRTKPVQQTLEHYYSPEKTLKSRGRIYVVDDERMTSRKFVQWLKQRYPTELGALRDVSVHSALNHAITAKYGNIRNTTTKTALPIHEVRSYTVKIPDGADGEFQVLTRDPETRILWFTLTLGEM